MRGRSNGCGAGRGSTGRAARQCLHSRRAAACRSCSNGRAARRCPHVFTRASLSLASFFFRSQVPNTDGTKDKLFLTESFDPTTHFETAITDVLNVYKRITGEALVLTDGPPAQQQ